MVTPDNIPTLDGYTYVSTLGRGGFSDVHLFQQRFPRRKVAVKVLRIDELDAALRRQFVAEANVMARLSSHPAIATIFAADISAAGDPYLVMEHYARGSLANGYRDAPLSVEDVLRHGVRIATALEHAHRGGVVHRDVKPANILLNDYGAAVLTDFGISVGEEADGETTILRASRASVESQTSAAGSHGVSVPWAPPEALADIPVSDARSDIYSLGATLYTLLEGRTPFEVEGASNGALQLSRRIERGKVGEFTRDAPEELRDALQRMMAVDPEERPGSAQKVAEALQAIQGEQGLAVTPIELHAAAEEAVESNSASDVIEAEPTVRRAMPDEIDIDTRTRPPARPGVDGVIRMIGAWIRAHARIVIVGMVVIVTFGTIIGVNAVDRQVPTTCPDRFLSAMGYQVAMPVKSGGVSDEIAESNEDHVVCAVAIQDGRDLVVLTRTSSSVRSQLFQDGWTCPSDSLCRSENKQARIYDVVSEWDYGNALNSQLEAQPPLTFVYVSES